MRLPRAIYSALKAHAMDSAPHECVGLLAVDPATDPEAVVYSFRAENVAEDPVAGYLVSPAEQLSLLWQIESAGLSLAAVYHSHPRAEATLSPIDLAVLRSEPWQPYPDVLHVVMGMARGFVTRAWKVADGRVEAEALEVVDKVYAVVR